jgi:membrane protein implicated in regulation of membrane protease activity
VQQRSSIAAEIGWLVYFFLIFIIAVYVLNVFVVPHHFNDKIADTFAAIIAALAMIATRAAYTRRVRNR